MSKTITSIQIQKKNKERVNLFLDGEFAFALNLLAAAQLKTGQVLSADEIEQLHTEDERFVAYQRALFSLGFRPRSQAELSRALREKGYDEEIIAHVVERLLREGYLNDEAFAEFWVENREQFRPRSARALRYELRQKGVERTVIDAAVTGLDEEAAAWAAVEAKLTRWSTLEKEEFTRKIMGFLARRGFSYATTRRISERAWSELGKSGDLEIEME